MKPNSVASLHPSENVIEMNLIKKRSIVGVVAYASRTLLLQLVALLATLLLAAFLTPEEFGIFFLVSSIVNIFIFFSDIGLAASLIQKKTLPTNKDLSTTFTIQQLLSFFIFSSIVLLTPFWKTKLLLDENGLFLLYALGASFIFASLKTIPSILLERSLEFNKLIIPQIIENVVFYSVAVFLAWKGFGVTSYTVAVVLRGVVGIVAIYMIMPWRPEIGISKEALNGLLRFGAPFQINDLLARIKDDLLIVAMKRILTDKEIGFLGWAKRWSLFPFRFTVDAILRVTFPAFSRLQSETQKLQQAIEKSLFFISLIAFPLLLGMMGLSYPITQVVESYHKWQPALPALYIFIIDVCFTALTTPLTNLLNAIGQIKITLRLMIFWTGLIWVAVFPAITLFGFTGVAAATALVGASSLITIPLLKRKVPFQFTKNVFPQLFSSLLMLVFLWTTHSFSSQSIRNVVVTALLGGMLYAGLIVIFLQKRLFIELKIINHSLKLKS